MNHLRKKYKSFFTNCFYIVIVAMLSAFSTDLNQKSELSNIESTINKYIEGTKMGKPNLVKEAFYSDFKLFIQADDTLRIIDGKQYIENITEGKVYNRIAKIRNIDIENNAALAKVEVYFPETQRIATDYVLMLKTAKGWKMLHKFIDLKNIREVNDNINKDELDQIKSTLHDYIDGTANSDVPQIKRAFWNHFNLYYIKNNEINIIDGERYIENFENNKYNRIGKILSVDFEGTAASAKIEVHMPDRNRTVIDYLALLKLNGQWKIIHKSFTDKVYD